ncbi:hypothetical protein NPIL_432131, partial [Nephila pilipes]
IPPEFGLALQGFLEIEDMMLKLTVRENPPFSQTYYTALLSKSREEASETISFVGSSGI